MFMMWQLVNERKGMRISLIILMLVLFGCSDNGLENVKNEN